MSIEKMREEFEAAYTKRLRDAGFESVIEFRRREDGYANLFTDGAWWAWQASRAAIEVELPKVSEYFDQSEYPHTCEMLERDFKSRIESLGLKVKGG